MARSARSRRIAADFLREQLEMDGMSTSSLSNIFKEEPPTLDTFLYDAKYLNHLRPTNPVADESGYAFKLSPIQYDFVRNFEQIFLPELYIAMVEEFGEYWSPLPMKNMFALEFGKGCPVAGEEVYSAKTGQWIPVEEVAAGVRVAAVDPSSGVVTPSENTESWSSGVGACVEVVTSTGAKTRVYEGHRFLTQRGWVEARELTLSDKVANVFRLPVEEPTPLPPEHVELLGFWLGDGSISNANSGIGMKFAAWETNALNRYVSILESLGLTPTIDKSRDNQVNVTAGQGRTVCHAGHALDEENSYILPTGKAKCRTCRREANRRAQARLRGEDIPQLKGGRKNSILRDIAEKYGVMGMNSHTKRIPDEVFSLPDSQVELFLTALWGTDGWVEKDRLGYCSVSEDLARGVYKLLKRLGIRATLHQKKTSWTYKGEKKYSTAWVVGVVTQPDILTFNSRIRLLDKSDKQDELTKVMLTRKPVTSRVLEDISWDKVKSITPIGDMEYFDLSVPGLENYVSTDGLVAHNSGKDTVVRIGFTRIASLLGHMVSPQSYYNMASTDSIHLLNVAATAPQARKAFFDPMKKLFKSNKHLSEFFHGDDPAEGSNQIRLKNDIYIISGNSIAENQEGLNLLGSCADEISAFKVAEEFKNTGGGRQAKGAEGIVSFLRSSSTSRFPKTYKVAQISYPRFQGDAIEKAMAQGRESIKKYGYENSQWYVSGPYATWEVKPGVTKEDFREHYDEDPEMAATMYECKPPKSTNVFIRDEGAIDAAFSTIKEEPIQVEYYWGLPPRREDVPPELQAKEGWQVNFLFSEDLQPIPGALYALHGDMAIRGDRAGIAMSHVASWNEEGDDERPVITNDFTFTFESDLTDPDHPREVQIRWYRQLIWGLIDRGFPIEMVTYDQFQSADMVQTLNAYGIDAGLLSLDRNDKVYQAVKDVILDGRLNSYRTDPIVEPLAMKELKRLRRVGKKVDHPPAQSKDASDALAGSVFNAIQVGGEEESSDESELNPTYSPGPMEMAMYYGAPSRSDMEDAMFGGTSSMGSNPFSPYGGGASPIDPMHRY